MKKATVEQEAGEGFEINVFKHVYFVSFIGEKRNLAGLFGEKTVGSRVLTLDFLVDNEAALTKLKEVVNFIEGFRSCAILGFKELDAY